ncbi:hypothetical protein [Paenibacillus dendritiformis]|uniref:hypothetical protein n=1 Tax=Paenibacillus dendritiformis TaxID=130049 RepID=UPI000301E1D4|nr:hypothetical protein [Paenibacillus dendritiformis]CAH8767504.1 hypothetical protein H7S4_000174 [Paenibacillus dendritiformis]
MPGQLSQQSGTQEHGSWGLKNVHDRLWICYEDKNGITPVSVLGAGTTVTNRVPLNGSWEVVKGGYDVQRIFSR